MPTDDGLDVMIVEDNPTNRRVLQKILERAGHRCLLARDGDEALDLIGKHAVDVIILDMNMPGVHGTEVARLCRLMGGRPAATPIMMFSANVTPEAREECLHAGANAFMPKPIQVDLFLKTLAELAGKPSGPLVSAATGPACADPTRSDIAGSDEPVLDLQILKGLETMSKDPAFLDELVAEYLAESRRLLRLLAQDIDRDADDDIKEALHSLRGSALSIGATSMKMICKHFERLLPCGTREQKKNILQELNHAFIKLANELETYRHQRMSAEQASSRPD